VTGRFDVPAKLTVTVAEHFGHRHPARRVSTTTMEGNPPVRRNDDDLGIASRNPSPGDRLLAGTVRGAGAWVALTLLLDLLVAAAAATLPALLGRALDQVVSAGAGGDWSQVPASLALPAAAVAVMGLGDVAGELLAGVGVARTTGSLRRRLARHTLAVGPAVTARRGEGDIVARLVGATASAARGIVLVSGLTVGLIPPVVAIVALALIDPWLAVTFAVGMVAVTGAVRVFLRDARTVTEGYLETQGEIAARLVDALSGARTIAAAGTVDLEAARVLRPLPRLAEQGVAMWRTLSRLAFQGEPVVLITQVAVIAVAGARLSTGQLSAGQMLAVSRYAVMAAGIASVVDELAALTRARAGAHRVAEVLAEPAPTRGDRPLPSGPGRLELVGVTAGPPGAPVLQGLDLVVPAGSTVALVGRSGAGKSLAAALAGRLRDPTAGEVRLDGVPVHRLDRSALRRAVAYAFERPVLLGRTVADAIAFGVERPDPGVIRRAAREARADDFVRLLPGGYRADMSATTLSGGEVQRLGLARAFARDARVLVLDDALSSLDTATEAEIAAVLTAPTGQTRLIVTHRLATAARSDLVAWLDGGRIRAMGPHRQLWGDPAYRALFHCGPTPRGPVAPVERPAPVGASTGVAIAGELGRA
jgi:ATP-binding cassette, subfamily B, bacterial